METLEQLVEILKSGATAWNALIAAKRAVNAYYCADLSDADLRDANLRGADLSGANLRGAKADFVMKCLQLPKEITGLREALISGKIDGSCYEGECCCFVGTMEKLAVSDKITCPIQRIADSPIERLFVAIKAGDTPETNQVSAIVVGWIDELLATFETIKTM